MDLPKNFEVLYTLPPLQFKVAITGYIAELVKEVNELRQEVNKLKVNKEPSAPVKAENASVNAPKKGRPYAKTR